MIIIYSCVRAIPLDFACGRAYIIHNRDVGDIMDFVVDIDTIISNGTVRDFALLPML